MLKLRTATERKLAMAKYYLQRMRDTQNSLNAFDFECELESFLTHTGSITNLPRPYSEHWFMEQEYGHKPDYKDWYNDKVRELQSDEVMQFLRNERNIAVHFKKQNVHTTSTAEVDFIESLTASSSIEVTTVNLVEGTKETVESLPEIVQPAQPTDFTLKRTWEFVTNELTGDKEVIPVCEKYLETLERLVNECHAKGF